MSTEFITLDSKLAIRGNAISERKVKHTEPDSFHLVEYVIALALIALALYWIFAEGEYSAILFLLIPLLWLQRRLKKLYIALFVKTWKPTIFFNEIRDVTTTALHNGLETQVTLHLTNGRKKFYIFRNAENQLEEFLQLFDFGGRTAMSLG
jgi:hypothetical protein